MIKLTLDENHADSDHEEHTSLFHTGEVEAIVGEEGQGELYARVQEQVQEVDVADTLQ